MNVQTLSEKRFVLEVNEAELKLLKKYSQKTKSTIRQALFVMCARGYDSLNAMMKFWPRHF